MPVETTFSEITMPVETIFNEITMPVETTFSEITMPVDTIFSEITMPVETTFSEITKPVDTIFSEIRVSPYYSNSEHYIKNESKINIDDSKYKFTTTLTSPIQKNDTYIYVKDQINFKIGDLIEINDSVNISIRKVIGFSSIIVDNPIDYNYKIGTKVSILKISTENNSNQSNLIILITCIISILLILSLSITIYLYSKKTIH
jgi:hypothetical protein